MTRSFRAGSLALLFAAASSWQVPAAAQEFPTTLPQAVAIALELHPALRAERARVGAAEQGIAEARGNYLPQARLDGFGTRFQEPMVIAPLHGFNPQEPPEFNRTLMQVQASVGLTLLDGGLRRAGVNRAEAGVAASERQLEAARATVIMEVATSWLEVSAGRETVAAHEARIVALGVERDRVRQLVEVGRAAPLDSLRVQAAMQAADAERIAAVEQVMAAEAALARLVGQSGDAVRGAVLAPVHLTAPLPIRSSLHAEARRANPEAAVAEARVAQAEAQAAAVQSSRWPELRLVGGYTDYWSGDGRLTGEWQGGLRVGFPVFTGGIRRAASQRASMDLDATLATRDAVILRLETALDRALAAEAGAQARAAALVAAVERYEEVVRIEQLALDAGAGTRRDWIVAQADLVSARSDLIGARHAQVIARLEVGRLTGTLTPESLSALLEIEP